MRCLKKLGVNQNNKMQDIKYNGAIDDPIDERDYQSREIGCYAPVEWIEKKTFRQFPNKDQDGSLSCFPANTLVLMQDFLYKPISDISIGDMVFTHNGNIKKVSNTFQRKWQGTMKSLKLWGDYQQIEASCEHPFFAIKRKNYKKRSKEIHIKPEFYKIEDLQKGDWVGLPLNKIERDTTIYDFEKDPEFLWVLGLFLAEGSISEYGIVLSLHKKEKEFYEKVKRIMSKYGTNVAFYEKKDDLGMAVNVYGKKWAEIFLELGNKICDKKEINKRLMFISPELQMNIVKGYSDGDGHLNLNGNMTMVSTSLKLLTQIKIILLRNGIYSCLQQRKDRDNRKRVWVLEYSKDSRYSFIKDNWCFVLIKEIKHIPQYYGGHIYNIEVEDDNSYVVRGVGVHNCVAQAVSKILGIENYLEEGRYFTLSARDIYVRRSNAPAGGMIYREAMKIGKEFGASLEALIPSESKSEVQMNDISDRTPYTEVVGRLGRGGEFISIPVNSIDEIASIIATGKAVLLGFRFDYNEWDLEVPVMKSGSQLSCGHGVAGVDFTLCNGVKAIVIDESWGFKNIKQRIITEDWFTSGRCVCAWYYQDLSNSKALEVTTEKYIFNNDLEFGMQNEEVKELQKVLMSLGLLKILEPTGYFGSLTLQAVRDYQTLKLITPVSGYVGKLTRQKLNLN